MLRNERLAKKAQARAAARRAGPDMALASTIVFFGVLPAAMATGLILVQAVSAIVP